MLYTPFRLRMLALFAVAILTMTTATLAFQAPNPAVAHSCRTTATSSSMTTMGIFKKKKEEEDLSFIETRDMTREEMKELNAQNEDIMNAELVGMTLFSLVISLPLLYLAWVGLFSETSEIAGDLSGY